MDRDRLIELLINDQLGKLDIAPHSRRFLFAVEQEFLRFGNMSDEELALEISRRGLSAELDSSAEPVDPAWDADADEGDEDRDVDYLLRDIHRGDEDGAPAYG